MRRGVAPGGGLSQPQPQPLTLTLTLTLTLALALALTLALTLRRMQEGPLQLLGEVAVPDYARLGPADAALIAASLLSFLPPHSAARTQLNTTVATDFRTLPLPLPLPLPLTLTLPLPRPLPLPLTLTLTLTATLTLTLTLTLPLSRCCRPRCVAASRQVAGSRNPSPSP